MKSVKVKSIFATIILLLRSLKVECSDPMIIFSDNQNSVQDYSSNENVLDTNSNQIYDHTFDKIRPLFYNIFNPKVELASKLLGQKQTLATKYIPDKDNSRISSFIVLLLKNGARTKKSLSQIFSEHDFKLNENFQEMTKKKPNLEKISSYASPQVVHSHPATSESLNEGIDGQLNEILLPLLNPLFHNENFLTRATQNEENTFGIKDIFLKRNNLFFPSKERKPKIRESNNVDSLTDITFNPYIKLMLEAFGLQKFIPKDSWNQKYNIPDNNDLTAHISQDRENEKQYDHHEIEDCTSNVLSVKDPMIQLLRLILFKSQIESCINDQYCLEAWLTSLSINSRQHRFKRQTAAEIKKKKLDEMTFTPIEKIVKIIATSMKNFGEPVEPYPTYPRPKESAFFFRQILNHVSLLLGVPQPFVTLKMFPT